MASNSNVGIKQIAEAAGVAPSTVSLVLNNKGSKNRIAPETQERIRSIASAMQYQPMKRAKNPQKQKTPPLIAAFWPMEFENDTATALLAGALRCIKEHRLPYEIVLVPFTQGALSEKAHIIKKQYFSAAIYMGLFDDDQNFIENSRFDIPAIIMNRQTHSCHSVMIDEYEVGQFACKHFLQRGHKKLCIISPNYSSKSLSLRSVGFWDALQSRSDGRSLPSSSFFRGENSDAGGYDAADQMFQAPDIPTAIFVANDIMVPGIVQRVLEGNKSIPEDIEIISFGDTRKNLNCKPQITSFLPPVEKMSYDCIQILHRDITGAIDMRISRNYTARCIFRESCPAEGTFNNA